MARKGSVKANKKHSKAWGKWHWWKDGRGADEVFEWGDVDLPEHLIEIGRLVGFHVKLPGYKKPSELMIKDKYIGDCYLTFDPEDPKERIYACLDGEVRRAVKRTFWDKNKAKPVLLGDLAKKTGGHHQGEYAKVKVKPIGPAHAVIYATHKKGDGPSNYIHHFSEETGGAFPVLAADARGRLWLAGGVYTCPVPGITD